MKPKIYKRIPKGWKVLEGAATAPNGYVWIWNGKSRFSGEYRTGLIPIDNRDEQNPKKVNTSNKTRKKKQKNSEKGNDKTNLATKTTKPSKKYSEYSKGIKRNA